jgi:hypothetical protein
LVLFYWYITMHGQQNIKLPTAVSDEISFAIELLKDTQVKKTAV